MIYVVICQGCKEEFIRETGSVGKEWIYIYRQHIRQLQYQQLAVEEHFCTSKDGKFHMFTFFKILQENKSVRKSYDDYFIHDFKLFLNKKSQVAKPLKVAGS